MKCLITLSQCGPSCTRSCARQNVIRKQRSKTEEGRKQVPASLLFSLHTCVLLGAFADVLAVLLPTSMLVIVAE